MYTKLFITQKKDNTTEGEVVVDNNSDSEFFEKGLT